jgi:hypothetical protein
MEKDFYTMYSLCKRLASNYCEDSPPPIPSLVIELLFLVHGKAGVSKSSTLLTSVPLDSQIVNHKIVEELSPDSATSQLL